MSQRIMIWGAARHAKGESSVASFEASGKNFGNILIGNAVYTFLADNTLIHRLELKTPEEANEKCDHIVLPAANFLWKDFDFGGWLVYLEKTRLPITMIGVGAQTHDRTMISPIHPNTLKLMRLISERSTSIGVRGYYTAEVLAANGIHNVRVIGCPSLYTTRSPSVKIDAALLRSPARLSVNFSRRVARHSFSPQRMQAVENALLALALERNSTFVAQDEMEEISLSVVQASATAAITSYFKEIASDRVVDFFKTKTKYFTEYASWASYIRSQSVSVGTRFHGNLIALINGVPALPIVHDSRTMEMCSLMACPTLHINEIEESKCRAEYLLERIKSLSFEHFESSYRKLFRRFADFLGENGLQHNLPRSATAV